MEFGASPPGYARFPGAQIRTLSPPFSMEAWFNSQGDSTGRIVATGGPDGSGSGPPWVAQFQQSNSNGAGVTSLSCNITTRAGSAIFVTVYSAVASVTGVTDSAGNTYTQYKAVSGSSAPEHVEIWGCANASPVTSVSVTVSASSGVNITALEVRGSIAASVVDVTGGSYQSNAQSWSYSTGALSAQNDLFIGIAGIVWDWGMTPSSMSAAVSGASGEYSVQNSNGFANDPSHGYTWDQSLTTWAGLNGTGGATYSGSAPNGYNLPVAFITVKSSAPPAPYLLTKLTPTNAGATVEADANDGTTVKSVSAPSATNYADGLWHHVVVTVGSGTLDLYVDRQLQGTTSTSISSFATTQARVGDSWDNLAGSVAYAAFYSGTVLTATQVLNHYQQGFTGYPVQDSGSRVSTVLEALGVLAPPSNVNTGYSMIQQPTGDLSQTTVLSYLQSVELAENGFLYADASGVVQFLNRYDPIQPGRNTSLTTFGDAPGEVPYMPKPDIGRDNLDLKNASFVQRQSGTVYVSGVAVGTQGGAPQTAQDATSIAKYAEKSVMTETALLLTTDAECLARAQWNVSLYAYPKPRVRSLKVQPLHDLPTRMPAVLFREVMDRATVNRRPWGSSPVGFGSPMWSQDHYIESVAHDIDLSKPSWETTYSMWPALTKQFWLLGDPTYGVLGTTTTLAY